METNGRIHRSSLRNKESLFAKTRFIDLPLSNKEPYWLPYLKGGCEFPWSGDCKLLLAEDAITTYKVSLLLLLHVLKWITNF